MKRSIATLLVLMLPLLGQPANADIATRTQHIEAEYGAYNAELTFYGQAAADSVLRRNVWGRGVLAQRDNAAKQYTRQYGHQPTIITIVVNNDSSARRVIRLRPDNFYAIQRSDLSTIRYVILAKEINVLPGNKGYTFALFAPIELKPDDTFFILTGDFPQ